MMDVTDPALVDLFEAERPAVVNHHAANPSVSLSVREPIFDARQNVLGTIHVLEAVRRAVWRGHLYFLRGGHCTQPSTCRWTGPSGKSVSPYALTQAYRRTVRAPLWPRVWFAAGLPAAMRMSTAPRQDPFGEAASSHLCPELLTALVPEIHWDGEQTRDFVYAGGLRPCQPARPRARDGQRTTSHRGGYHHQHPLQDVDRGTAGNTVPRRGPRRAGDVRHSYWIVTRSNESWAGKAELRPARGPAANMAAFCLQTKMTYH